MNSFHHILTAFTFFCFLLIVPLIAQETTPPFVMDKSYSADQTMTFKDGSVIKTRSYVDGDKLRSDRINPEGEPLFTIVRKDRNKIYVVTPMDKTFSEMDYDTNQRVVGFTMAGFGPEGKFRLMGPESIDGIDCTKYQVVSDDNRLFYFWFDAAHNVPVQMEEPGSSVIRKWTNYLAGPQEDSLFEIPEGYHSLSSPKTASSPIESSTQPRIKFLGYLKVDGGYAFQLQLLDRPGDNQPGLKKTGEPLEFENYIIGPFQQKIVPELDPVTHVQRWTDQSTIELDKSDGSSKIILQFRK